MDSSGEKQDEETKKITESNNNEKTKIERKFTIKSSMFVRINAKIKDVSENYIVKEKIG